MVHWSLSFKISFHASNLHPSFSNKSALRTPCWDENHGVVSRTWWDTTDDGVVHRYLETHTGGQEEIPSCMHCQATNEIHLSHYTNMSFLT